MKELDSAAGQAEGEAEPAGRTLVWAGAWAAGADFAARPPAWPGLVGGAGGAGGRPRPGWSSQASSSMHPWASSVYSPQVSTFCRQKNIWKMLEVLKQIGILREL